MTVRPRRLPALAALAAATTLVLGTATPAGATTVPVDTPAAPAAAQESASGLWMVRLAGESLAAAAATAAESPAATAAESPAATAPDAGPPVTAFAPAGDGRVDPRAPASQDHLAAVDRQHEELLARAGAELGRDLEVVHAYRHVLNGLAVVADAAEAAALADLPGVVSVAPDRRLTLDTDATHDVISSPAVWDGETGPGLATRGEGVIVGVIDTGVNPDHPSFAAVDGEGYQHTNPYGEGNYVGVCDPEHPEHEDICNDKLIGAWRMVFGSGARDDHGHGSHVGSTIAGNVHEMALTLGDDTHARTIQGVAPRANVVSYKTCVPSFGGRARCLSTAAVAAVDQAVADGVDVLNYSISGPDNPWTNNVDLAFLEASGAGIFIAASAGNDGPEVDTVTKTAPWNATVAATSHDRVFAHRLDLTTPAPPELSGLAAVPGDGSPPPPIAGELHDAGTVDPGNAIGCDPFAEGAFDGVVALIRRGECDFSDKVDHAADAGATGVVVYNQFGGPPITMGAVDGTTIPSVMVSNADGEALVAHLAAGGGPVEVAVGTGSEVLHDDEWTDVVADFSSRGPSQFDLLAPTFAAPGRNILAASAEADGDPLRYAVQQGTSMASPHAAGAGALLAALHPDWSPAQIRSALAVTATRDGIVKEDGVTPADPHDVGSGRIDLAMAGRAGLTLDESREDFADADPAAGGDPRTLNLPSMVDHHCTGVCTFTRVVTAEVGADYTVTTTAPGGVEITATPDVFTVVPGGEQELTITVDVRGLTRGDWLFGGVDLTTDASHPGGLPVAGAHLPVAVLPAQPAITVDPEAIESETLDVAETEQHVLTVGNEGGLPLTWEVSEDGCALPDWVSVEPDSGTVDPFGSQEVTVTFDSTGLDDGGEFAADLCLAGNDPERPVVPVALSLTVVPIPVIDVTGTLLDGAAEDGLRLPAGLAVDHSLTLANAGHGTLEWTLADPDAGPSDERLELLRDGVLLIPNQSTGATMAFDTHTGELLDEEFTEFVPFDPEVRPTPFSYSPIHLLPNLTGDGFLVSDQLRWMIPEYDLAGDFRRVLAPTSGMREPAQMANLRGMAWSPWGTLLVTVASRDNADSVVELAADGTFLGTFIEPGAGGLDNPWDVLVREDDILVGASSTSAILRYDHDGNPLGQFAELNWPAQLVELDNGNILTVNWSGGGEQGIREFDADGNLLHSWTASGSAYRGVTVLGDGNLLVTTSTGVHSVDPDTGEFETMASGIGNARYITPVRLPDVRGCSTPDELPWLTASQDSGATRAGDATELTVTVDTTGLAAGVHEAKLCVVSNAPGNPLVAVPVTVEVTGWTCDRVVSGQQSGPLPVRSGITCLGPDAEVTGPVSVSRGGGLIAVGATVAGPVSASGAAVVDLGDSVLLGGLSVRGTGTVRLAGNDVAGPVSLVNNRTGDTTPPVVTANRINGPLWCAGNEPPPTDLGEPNQVSGPTGGGQC